ncbi:MAG: SDR family oxidoreductase [Thermoplasmatales archaeon]|nr:SDR family oxidoreductase [Candidatus Thermoplasmatota archaeon]MDA8055175.1 SDR family oxidoreductase [Thermoplasmatales archaeon]
MMFTILDQERKLLDDRVATSISLGANENLVLHGGGNTSVKLKVRSAAGKEISALFVKSSGSDLATVTPEDFTALKMNDLMDAKLMERMSDDEMSSFIKSCMLDPDQAYPSVEVFIHAFINSRFVDHSHADYIVALTNTNLDDKTIADVFKEKILVIPYTPPGFKLARHFLDTISERDLSNFAGVILRNHGLVTWGDNARESYETHLRLVKEAQTFIESKWKGLPTKNFEKVKEDGLIEFLPKLRGLLSKEKKKILTWDNSEEAVGFSLSDEADKFASLGPATPDMLVRTKKNYLFSDDVSGLEGKIDNFVNTYKEEFARYAPAGRAMHDPYPSVIVLKGFGLITAASTKKESDILRDEAIHSFRVASAARAIGKNRFITDQQCHEMEYWPFQEAKLTKKRRKELEGHIGLVTGAASGIGKVTFSKFVDEGILTIGGDIDQKIDDVAKELGRDAYGLKFDISNEESVQRAYKEIVRKFGGIDVVFNNAGYLKPSPLEDTSLQDLKKHIDINSIGTFLVTKEAFRIMKSQGMGGTFVFNVTKNVSNPGEGMMSYGTSKAFAAQLSRYVALEGGKYGIRSNVINPDKIFRESKIWENGILENRARAKGITPDEYKKGNLLHVEVLPDHVANIVVELIKERVFGATTGTMIPIDGGIK